MIQAKKEVRQKHFFLFGQTSAGKDASGGLFLSTFGRAKTVRFPRRNELDEGGFSHPAPPALPLLIE
jgi:hypothetical protein